MKKAKKPVVLFVMVMMLGACAGNDSRTVTISDFCNRVQPPPITEEILDALDQVPNEWQLWYGKIEEDAAANCPEWSE